MPDVTFDPMACSDRPARCRRTPPAGGAALGEVFAATAGVGFVTLLLLGWPSPTARAHDGARALRRRRRGAAPAAPAGSRCRAC